MDRTGLRSSEPSTVRHTVASYHILGVPFDELDPFFAPGKDPSRWNPFVVAAISGSNVIAVVAPNRLSGVHRLHGEITYRPDRRGFTFDAVGGLRGHGLRITHQATPVRTGSFRTTMQLTTTLRGPISPLVSRHRIRVWHDAEIEALLTRIEHNHARRDPLAAHTKPHHRNRPLTDAGTTRAFATATITGKDTHA